MSGAIVRSRANLPTVSRKKTAVLDTLGPIDDEQSHGVCRLSAFPTRTLALLDASTHRAWVRGIVHRGHEHDVRVFVEQVLRSVAARAHRAGGVVHQHGDAASARHQRVESSNRRALFSTDETEKKLN